jgi:hypothetical protein
MTEFWIVVLSAVAERWRDKLDFWIVGENHSPIPLFEPALFRSGNLRQSADKICSKYLCPSVYICGSKDTFYVSRGLIPSKTI